MTDTTEDTTEQDRDFAAALFGRAETDETDDEHTPPVGNFVPKEGNLSQPKDNPDLQVIRDLFDA